MTHQPADDLELDRTESDGPPPTSEVAANVNTSLIAAVSEALAADDHARARDLVKGLGDADFAHLLQALPPSERRLLVLVLRHHFAPEVLAELDDEVRQQVIDALGPTETAAAVADLDSDDAVHVLEDLDAGERERLLAALPGPERLLIEENLAYPEDSAGRLMQRELIAVPAFWDVRATLEHIRRLAVQAPDAMPTEFHVVFVIDPAFHPVGAVPLSRLLRAPETTPVASLVAGDLPTLSVTTPQDAVARLFRRRDLLAAPVVDTHGRLVGVITVDDVVDVIDEQYEDEILHLGGVGNDDFYRSPTETARSRFAWLFVNLLTAILASLVIGLFEGTIEKMVALAVLMPIVASMGGNAGTQTLTVAVRALATQQLISANTARFLGKELLVGTINGVLFAVIAAVIAWAWFGDARVAWVIALAMMANLVCAALAGFAFPILLQRLKVDPAVASGVFVTTVTDVVGFFAFLGLASWLIG